MTGAAISGGVGPDGFAGRARRRQMVVTLAAGACLVLMALGLVFLFSVHRAAQATQQADAQLTRLLAGVDAGRQAQVAFKIQVQEWKNVLLRGHDPADRARHWASLEAQEAAVGRHLRELGGVEDVSPAEELLQVHAGLGERYRAALAGLDPADPLSPRTVDAAVRGIDRQFDRDLDALVEALLARVAENRAAYTADSAARFATLRRVVVMGSGASMALILLGTAVALLMRVRG